MLRRQKAPKATPTYYQPAELAKIKVAFDAESPKWRTLGYLCMVYGDRRSEFAGIKRSCIDFNTHTILLLGTVLYHPRRGAYEKPYPKNEKGRLLPMSPEVEALLKGYLAWLDTEKEKWGDQWIDTDYIFCGERGDIINPDTITKHFAYMTKKWQKIDPTFPHINPHAFRHTVVSLLLHNGVDKISVADFVGDDPATLDRYYAHLINDGRLQAASAMNSIVGFASAENAS